MHTFYIHGYGSSPESRTFQDFKEAIPDIECLTYDSNDPVESVNTLVDYLMSIASPIHIIASSLGGWYAEKVAARIPVSLTLYNPSLNPRESLKKYGLSKTATDSYDDIVINPNAYRTVVLCDDDEVVCHRAALIKYRNISNVIVTNGGHRMTPKNMGIIVDDWKFRSNQLG